MRRPFLLGFTRLELILIVVMLATILFFGLAVAEKVLEFLTVLLLGGGLLRQLYLWIYYGDSADGQKGRPDFYSFPGAVWLGYGREDSSKDASGESALADSADSGGDSGFDSGSDSGGGDGGGK